MRKWLILSIVLLLALSGAGCAPPAPLVPPTRQPVSPLPAPTEVLANTQTISPLPAPTASATQVRLKPGLGSVTGQAVRLDGTPMKGITIYAALTELRDGVRLAGVDPVNDVHANTDAEGGFVLMNVKPGEYAIATQSPVGVIMPHNANGEIVLYQVKADEQTNLGRLQLGYVYPDS